MTTSIRSLLVRMESDRPTLYFAIRSAYSVGADQDIIVKYGILSKVSKLEKIWYSGPKNIATVETWDRFKAEAGKKIRILTSGGERDIPLFRSMCFLKTGKCSLDINTLYNYHYDPDSTGREGSQDITYTLEFSVIPFEAP
jgi:hypothetical protein